MGYITRNFTTAICAVSIFMLPLFFSMMALLGVDYTGSESSIAYVAYIASVCFLSILSYLYSTVLKGFIKGEALLISICSVIFVLHALWVIFDPEYTLLLPKFLVLFTLLGGPGFFSAATILKLKAERDLIKLSEVLVVFVSLGIVFYSVFPSLLGNKTASLAGASYQTLSYFSAFAFGMLLIYNMLTPSSYRYDWCLSLLWRILSYGLMLGCIIGCFLGGGRGAFLLLLVYAAVCTVSIFLNKGGGLTANRLAHASIKFFAIISVGCVFVAFFWERDFIQSGFARATMFISPDGVIDLERGSSGRDVVYATALDYISQRPIFGYGPFGFMEKTVHAHNIFLETLLQFGVVGLFCLLLCSIVLFFNWAKNWSFVSLWVSGLFIYPLIMTMFSGSYMHSSIFIFCISFFSMYRRVELGYNKASI